MSEIIKEKIAESFESHYSRFGYKKTSMENISKDLRISKKTIYKYFISKDQLYHFLVEKTACQFREMIEPRLVEVTTYEKKMEQLVLFISQEIRIWLKENQDSFDFRFKFELTQRGFQEAYHGMAKDLYLAGIGNGEFSDNNVDLTIKFLDSILLESMQLIQTNIDLGIEQDTARSIIKLLK
jgi:AcrR family transcriptional regulator